MAHVKANPTTQFSSDLSEFFILFLFILQKYTIFRNLAKLTYHRRVVWRLGQNVMGH
jgi:hypothetical protein